MGAPKLQNGIGLANLPRSLQNKGLAALAFFPRFQESHNFSIHQSALRENDDYNIAYIHVNINDFSFNFYTEMHEYFRIRHELLECKRTYTAPGSPYKFS